jgi:hypothetical protein
LAELSQHQTNGGPAQEGARVPAQTLPVFGEAAAAIEPADPSLDDPTPRQHDEPADIAALDDLDADLRARRLQPVLEFCALIAAVGVELQQERIQAKQRARQQQAAVTMQTGPDRRFTPTEWNSSFGMRTAVVNYYIVQSAAKYGLEATVKRPLG